MSTLAQMRSRIADDLNRTDLNTQIDVAINRAIEYYYKGFRFWFNEKTATFNTVANQVNYGSADSIPTDMMEIDFVKIAFASTDNEELIPRTYDYIQQANVGSYAGRPADYAYYKENFWLYPVPSQAWTVTVSYAKSYTDLSADADTNDFTEEAEDLIESRAEWWLYKRIIKDYDLAQASKAEELEALSTLISETERIVKSGFVRPTVF